MIVDYLFFDCSNFLYRTLFGARKEMEIDLSKRSDRIKVINKFAINLVSISKFFGYSNAFFVFDGENIFRKNIYPEYKGTRSEKEEGFSTCIKEIEEWLRVKDFNVIKVDGLEADDCMALLCEYYYLKDKVIITADADLTQLCDESTFVLNPLGSKRIFIDQSVSKKFILETQPINSFYVLIEKVLKGCKGDNIAGITPKGFRKTKIASVSDYILQRLSSVSEFPKLIQEALNQVYVEVDIPTIENQLKLVCLLSNFFPQKEVDDFFKIDLLSKEKHLNFDNLLSDTEYYL